MQNRKLKRELNNKKTKKIWMDKRAKLVIKQMFRNHEL